MEFEFAEDAEFFDDLLRDAGGSAAHKVLFDIDRPADLKRQEFNRIRQSVFDELTKERGMVCELQLHDDCTGLAEAVDHMIPLSSNVLNKSRGVPRVLPKKVATQSFGSNDKANFLLACAKCNGFKLNKFERDLILRVLRTRAGSGPGATR